MPTPHSTLVNLDLHHNVGDSRTSRAWTLAAGTTDALLIENSNNNDLLSITTSTTPGSTLITFGNATDDPAFDVYGTLRVLGATSGGYCFTVATNAGTDNPFRVFAAAANGPHTVALDEAWMRIAEVGSDPGGSANVGHVYTKDAAGVTQLYYQASDGTVSALTPISGAIGGNVGANDNRVVRSDGVGGVTIQGSVVSIDDTGIITGSTGYTQASGNHSVTGNGTFTIGNGGTSTINVVPGSGGVNIGMLDNDSANFRVQQGSDYYIRCDTSNSNEKVTIGGVSPATMDVDIIAGDDITIAAAGSTLIQLADNTAVALSITEGANTYLSIDTTNTTELITLGTGGVNRVLLGGSATATTLLLGNPDADNIVATPVTTITIAATDSGTAGTNASDLVIEAGDNAVGSGAGSGGDVTIRAGSTTAASTGVGGDIILSGGNSGAGAGGTIRLQTGQTSTAVDRLTIEPNGAVQYVYQGATSMPVHFVERYRYTHNSASQTVLTYSVPSGGAVYCDVRVMWRRTAATTGAAIATVFGGAWNDGGTTDEIGGATFTSTMVARSGQASTDTVDVQIVADNAADEIRIQLTKANANDYEADVFVLVHQYA